jgi:hypothetical protein
VASGVGGLVIQCTRGPWSCRPLDRAGPCQTRRDELAAQTWPGRPGVVPARPGHGSTLVRLGLYWTKIMLSLGSIGWPVSFRHL